jgi:hypothetical protein
MQFRVKVGFVFKYAVGDVQQFPHNGDKGHFFSVFPPPRACIDQAAHLSQFNFGIRV